MIESEFYVQFKAIYKKHYSTNASTGVVEGLTPVTMTKNPPPDPSGLVVKFVVCMEEENIQPVVQVTLTSVNVKTSLEQTIKDLS